MCGNRLWCAVMVIVPIGAAVARGETLTYRETIPVQRTGWSQGVFLPQFDPSIGMLESIGVDLTGHIEGSAGFESLDASAAEIGLRFAGDVALTGPGGAFASVASPGTGWVATSGPFDGVIDLGGSSGQSWMDVSADATLHTTIPVGLGSALDYVGTGSVPFVVSSSGRSSGSGTGNLLLQFDQMASADVSVTYVYSVPEPAAALLLGAGMVLTMFVRGGAARAVGRRVRAVRM